MIYRKILVPLDGSEPAERALSYARLLAQGLNSEVILLTVSSPHNSLEHSLGIYLESRVDELKSSKIKASACIVSGDAATEILNFVAKNNISLVVMSSHGRSVASRWPLGSVAHKVLYMLRVPVLLVRARQLPKVPPKVNLGKILVCLDGSAFADAVMPHVESLAKALGSEIILLRSVEAIRIPQVSGYVDHEELEKKYEEKARGQAKRYLRRKAGVLEKRGMKVNSVLVKQEAAEAIINYADSKSVDLIALTTHGFTGIAKWAYGSVASSVVENSSKPVLLLRPRLPSAKD